MAECLTPDQKEWAYEVWCIGFTRLQIADALSVSERTIERLLQGKKKVRPNLKYNPRWKKDGVVIRRTSLYFKNCKVCGRGFYSEEMRQTICSDECRAVAKAESEARCKANRQEYNKRHRDLQKLYSDEPKKKESLSLSDVAKRASEMGMTYGEYMTRIRENGA